MKARLVLPLLAVACLGGALWIARRAHEVTAEALLASARGRMTEQPPDRPRALRELDEAFRLTAPDERELRAEILHERSVLFALHGLPEMALEDCRTLLAELGEDADALARASELCLQLGEPVPALEYATTLVALDAQRGKSLLGRSRVALADAPLAALERLARTSLPLSAALQATTLAQRAAVFAADEAVRTAAQEELLALFQRDDERRLAAEWVREAAEHLEIARDAFVESLSSGSTSDAVAGLQDLFLRGGAPRDAADLGRVALALPNLDQPMSVLARTASAMAALGRLDDARALVLSVRNKSPGAMRPHLLPSNPLRDELLEWCRLLERLAVWNELRPAAFELLMRSGNEGHQRQLALYLISLADLRTNQVGSASWNLEQIGNRIAEEDHLPVRVWSLRAEVARHQRQLGAERYALLQTAKTAALDPPPELRGEVGRAWERMAQIQLEAGETGAAEVSLTHALRCSPQRAASLEERWRELGRRSMQSGPAGSPYALWVRARSQADRGAWTQALTDARALVADYPGLGPALEVVAEAAEALNDYPLLISTSLEIIARGWPSAAASARLRRTPEQYFLPQDRVRWIELDPRASLERILRRLLARGDLAGAAMAARAEPARRQPPELLPFLARIELDAGLPMFALEMLGLLAPESELYRSSTGTALRAALMRAPTTREPVLQQEIARVVASGTAVDPGLVDALDALLATGRLDEARTVLEWLAPENPPFLREVLMRGTALRAITGEAGELDEGLERAAALLDDGRPELGRLVLALVRDDAPAVVREAHAVLATPFAGTVGRRAALLVLAGRTDVAAELVAGSTPDGRDALLELAAAAHAAGVDPSAWSSGVASRELLVLALASEAAPWSSWMLARTNALAPELRGEPWIRALRARALVAMGYAELAVPEVESGPPAVARDPRIAWMRVVVQRARGRDEAARAAEVAWLQVVAPELDTPELVRLAADGAVLREDPAGAAQILLEGLQRWPEDPVLLRALAELESVPGRRARAIDIYGRLLARLPQHESAPLVPAFLDVLREARDAGEVTETRWWAEVEALEAERPRDPAPVRELAARALERPAEPDVRGVGAGSSGRVHALARLDRFRSRMPDRSLESLRSGESLRWVRLLARFVPERAVALAESELRRDTDDPALWRASTEALLAAGRWQQGLARLEALQRVAPEIETARLLALKGFQIEDDPKEFLERVAAIERLAPEMRGDPLLGFYSGLAAAAPGSGVHAKARIEGAARAHELWQQREENDLDHPDNGRALGIAMFQARRPASALAVLREAFLAARTELEGDLFEALGHLVRSMPMGKARGEGETEEATDGASAAPGEEAEDAE